MKKTNPMSRAAFFNGLRAAIENPSPDPMPKQDELDLLIPRYGTKGSLQLAKKLDPAALEAARRSRLRAGDTDD